MNFAPPLDSRRRARIVIPFVIVTLIWGSTWTVIRGQLGVPVAWSVTWRFAVAGLAMLGFALWRGDRLSVAWRDQPALATIGISAFCANFNLVYRAEEHVTSGLVAVLFSLLVVCNAIVARIVFGQRLSRPFLAGTMLAMLGIVLLFAHEYARVGGDPEATLLGIALVLAAVGCASTGNVMQSMARMKALPMSVLLVWSMAWATLANAVVAWGSAGPPVVSFAPAYVAGVLYLGLIASAFAFTLYYGMIRLIGPARAGYVNVLVPVIAMGFSTVLERYRWSAETILGGALVVAGLAVAMSARSPARKSG